MNKLKVLILAAFVALAFSYADAEEHGEKKPEAAAEHGEKKEEGGGHEGGAAKETQQAWVPIEAKIQELTAKIKSKQESLEKLMEEKNHLPENSPHVKETLKEILKEHTELKNLAEEYQKNVNQLNYRFPERNAKANRSYGRIEVKSIDEMEASMGVDGKLNRNVKKMRSQYNSDKKIPEAHTEHGGKKSSKKEDNKPKSIEDEGSIIINK